MYSFPELIKNIRKEAGLTQSDFARALEVSPVLIAMVETGQKEVSKNMVERLATVLDVHPASITPFLYIGANHSPTDFSRLERGLVNFGEKMQTYLIQNRSALLKKYAKT